MLYTRTRKTTVASSFAFPSLFPFPGFLPTLVSWAKVAGSYSAPSQLGESSWKLQRWAKCAPTASFPFTHIACDADRLFNRTNRNSHTGFR